MNTQSDQHKARSPNWLPVPKPLGIDLPEIGVSDNDQFAKGEVVKFYYNQGLGFVKDNNQREISFNLAEIELVGPKNSKDYIKVGGRVGFDVSRSGNGLRIIKLKIY